MTFGRTASSVSVCISLTTGHRLLGLLYIANDFSAVVEKRYRIVTNSTRVSASVDFGNVSYELPAFHPHYAIPTVPSGSNHTPEFAQAARTQEAHDATIVVMKGLALTGFRVLSDDIFFRQVKDAFDGGSE